MGHEPTSQDRATIYWTGLGVALGAGLGLVLGLIGWGSSGIALGISVGAGVGVALGAAKDQQVRRAHVSAGESSTSPRT